MQSLKLDSKKLLGFRIQDTMSGSTLSAKLGAKLGSKIGVKPSKV